VPSISVKKKKDEDNLPMVKGKSMGWPSSDTSMAEKARGEGSILLEYRANASFVL
jgi:hypothetical protein